MTPKWDRHSIRAELARRGFTLTGLALDNGLYESACRQALDGRSKAGSLVIAKALETTVQELWPDRYLKRPRNSATSGAPTASPKCVADADREQAA